MARVDVNNRGVLQSRLTSGDAQLAMESADILAKAEITAPTDILVTIYDKVYKVRGECNDYISLQAAFPRHTVETGQIVMKGDDPLVEAVLL